jgi:hypothetical protein
MADKNDEKNGMDGYDAAVQLVAQATSGGLVAAAVAFPPLAILYAFGIGALLLAGAACDGGEEQE